ncbi:pseudouridine synthase, RluA family [Desulfitobacterium dichloroeliminans LMG P-21439]|uniref:Pseudouridine synthase n=1 Tax=Desulfitobacterium dichloroeliminans (strain LMG P-21439 / DCA1) TaxID=871963 RepID=L0F7E5_DESDL|nr:RluA family pseudouridine synthase [Desulfitobacterium dichloroeliminans]AGA68945.1 pseudouridine synthase, RluA family [Desulfitobacterium dichloroeliminans LMG P-21439]
MTQDEDNKKSKTIANAEFVVTESSDLFDFLTLKLIHQSRNNIKSLLIHKQVTVDGGVVTQHDFPLKEKQRVGIVRSVIRGQKENEQLQIIYEDTDLIVINKPAGLLAIADHKNGLSAYHLLTDYVRRTNPKARIFIVHRLDRDTSGVLMFAKNEKLKRALQDNWGSLVSLRGYVAMVEGRLREKSGRIHSWLKETKTLLVYSSQKAGGGLEAITNYQVVDETPNYSLLNIQLETGRKNQIRVHMKELGHSVVGDTKYGAKTNPLKRLGLHAHKLELRHPFSNQLLFFETEVPENFKTLAAKGNSR